MEWVIGYLVMWVLCSGYMASDNPKNEDTVFKATMVGFLWWAILPLVVLMKVTRVVGTFFKKIGL